ncbi:MAG: UDP-N-acetylmuramoyl-L-alanyl-D-glutamate--2,6-diaminopimelate ligase [Desulfobacteraceae bacterium]|nr:UDP-N-acetylmuramoyl-L-alanyl-D-glutamate--2,6-diaminopimelate ligase [Desulfobacteraceae bacterium]
MKLSHLLKSITVKSVFGKKKEDAMDKAEVVSIHYKAQDVKQGGIFVAIQGHVTDGHDYIDAALANGASAIITQKPVDRDSIIIEVEDTRKALSAMSAAFYGNPSEDLFLIGITGTNGKTTTAYLIESILLKAGFRVGVIGTINYRYSGKTFNSPVTTPESLDLQRIFAEMLNQGITHVVLEVSSHAIDQHRIANCWLDVGVFTNLTRDHLDYHGDMDSYWSCKKRLFTENLMSGPPKGRTLAVINCDDTRGKELAWELKDESSKVEVFELSDNMIRPSNIKCEPSGIAGRLSTIKGEFDFKASLVGKHNLKNIISATGVGIALNLPLDVIKAGIEDVTRIPGRLEAIPNTAGRFVYVDYAHTPDALENVLSSLRSIAQGRIICVFGCGGDRDKGKRHQMGEIAGRLSDITVITSDNPRTEAPMDIIAQVLDGMRKTSMGEDLGGGEKGYVVEPDRKKAIELAVTISRADDIVLIAGKGHETYQIIGNKTISFDDRKEAETALRNL